MDDGRRSKLRQYRSAFRQLLDEYEGQGSVVGGNLETLAQEIRRTDEDFPGLLPLFREDDFRGRWAREFGRYETARIKSWLSMAVARLDEAIESDAGALLVPCDFSMVRNGDIRRILERDFDEIRRAFAAQCWKSVIVLAGGSMEGLLAERFLREGIVGGVPRKLQDLIVLARKHNLVTPAVEKLSQSARDYRNLIHPMHEVKSGLTVDAEEARIAVEILRIVCRDLARAGETSETQT